MREKLSRPLWMAVKLISFGAVAALVMQGAPTLAPAETVSTPAVAPVRAAVATPAATPASTPTTARLSTINVVRELNIPHWLPPGEYVWDAEGAPAGQTIIVVNIRARVLSVYRAGHEIGRSSLIYGADNKPTPTGTFPILQKNADHWSNLYDAPMPHMLRLTWDGVAIHGSPALSDNLATRGCVGLPREFAELLFDVVDVGDQVIVWDGETSA